MKGQTGLLMKTSSQNLLIFKISETDDSNDQNAAQVFERRPLVLYALSFDCGIFRAIHPAIGGGLRQHKERI